MFSSESFSQEAFSVDSWLFDVVVPPVGGKRRIRDKRREEEELMYMVAMILPLIIGRKR